MKKTYGLILVLAALVGCSSKPLLPDAKSVKLSRNDPSKDCVEIGRVTGSTQSVHATSQDALDDMQREADKKGATFVRIEQYSDSGLSVTGTAFKCP